MLLNQTELDSRSLHITLNKGTIQLIRSLLSTMLVRVNVQSDHQNQHNANRSTEDRDHHYSSLRLILLVRVDQNPSISHTQINQTVSHIITMNDYYPLANSANTLCQAVDLLVASCNKMAPITVSVLLSPLLSFHRLNDNAMNSIPFVPINLYSKQTCLGRRWKARKKRLDL